MLSPDLYGFIAVLLRALILGTACVTAGGVIFRTVVSREDSNPTASGAIQKLLVSCAYSLAIAEIVHVGFDAAELMQSESLPFSDVTGATFFVSGIIVAAASAALAVFVRTRVAQIACPALAIVVLSGVVITSHSMARVEGRPMLAALTFLHHLAAAGWIGAMPYLILTLQRASDDRSVGILKRFSLLAMCSVVMLISSGFLMTRFYVGSLPALAGTSYGLMVAVKVILTSLLLIPGALNFRIVRDVQSGVRPSWSPLRVFAEAEAGIGLTVILAAASLTSSPPAIDLKADRVTANVIADRMRPKWPRLDTPPFSELTAATPIRTSMVPEALFQGKVGNANSADIAWSEYNHHWAGIVVLMTGMLSLFARWWRWARCWPLAFLGLALFLFIRADEGSWPLGPHGFWESFQLAEVTQHRIFVALIVAFAVFEWRVQMSGGGLRATLVFPSACAAGGALLLTHSHSLGGIRQEFLAELSHTPLALLAVIAGWSRWVEIRAHPLSPPPARWIWPICLVLVGAVLLNYREA